MSISSSSKRREFWRADWFVGACVVATVLLLWTSTDLVEGLERRFYDSASTQSSRQPSDRIAVIAIDDQSVANIGRWPWPRDVQAEMIDKLAGAKAKTVEKTLVMAATLSGTPLDGEHEATGYDPAAKAAAADDPFAKTAVFGRPGGLAHPAGGEGQSGSEG